MSMHNPLQISISIQKVFIVIRNKYENKTILYRKNNK